MELTKEYLDRLISDQIEESGVLEYKAGRALDRTSKAITEITKDVSAFANAAGGLIIYGVAEYRVPEKKHLPERYVPVDQSAFSREWLDQIIGQIKPRIDGLRIVPIHVGPGDADYCYAVEIPQSSTAHQALDLRYYKRRNFESPPMEDYEIRDVMNRAKSPIIKAETRIIHRDQLNGVLAVRLTNTSSVLATYYRVAIEMPVFLSGYISFEEKTPLEVKEDGRYYWNLFFRNGVGAPLFPECPLIHKAQFNRSPPIRDMNGQKVESIQEIALDVYADAMKPLRLTKNPAVAEKEWT